MRFAPTGGAILMLGYALTASYELFASLAVAMFSDLIFHLSIASRS